jgi:4-amino-4-deoxy-L-arabinose transferase-like glycosyltransferase
MTDDESDDEIKSSSMTLDWHYQRRMAMTPKRMLTVGGAWYLIEGAAAFFAGSGFDFMSYGFGILCLSLGILFLLARDELISKVRTAVFAVGFLSTFGISLTAYYAQWSGRFMDSALGYIPPTLWLVVSIGFFIVGRDNTSSRIRRLN